MAFIDTRFPDDISYGASGGPGFETDVITVSSGFEQRNSTWADSRCTYDVSHGVKKQPQLDALIAFFRAMKGRAHGFRFKDWSDFKVVSGQGIFVPLSATTFQMYRRYTTVSINDDRKITKPVEGTIIVTDGVDPVIDHTTGVVTVTSGTPSAWTGEFDVPCRFDVDQMKISLDYYNAYTWGNIPVVEIRQ
jgi:uncharacterized protein (TIGR02217 family)